MLENGYLDLLPPRYFIDVLPVKLVSLSKCGVLVKSLPVLERLRVVRLVNLSRTLAKNTITHTTLILASSHGDGYVFIPWGYLGTPQFKHSCKSANASVNVNQTQL